MNPVVVPPDPVWDDAMPAVGSTNAAKANAPANLIAMCFLISGTFPYCSLLHWQRRKIRAIAVPNQINSGAHIIKLACLNVKDNSFISNSSA
jgi:hypothetical protein